MGAVWIGDASGAEEWERRRRIAEHVASQPRHATPLSERFDWETEGQTQEHPGGTGMRRVRPKSVLAQLPRSARRAELVCTRGNARTPRVVAIVYPRGVPLDRAEVLTEHKCCPVGADVLVFCACGANHLVDGGRLRSVLLALPQSRKAPTVDVADVLMTQLN